MSEALEILLARLYSSVLEAESFLQDRAAYARVAGSPEEHLQDVLDIDAGSDRRPVGRFRRQQPRFSIERRGVYIRGFSSRHRYPGTPT